MDAQKTPIARTLNEFAVRKAAAAIQLTGRSLPASVVSRAGSIVTVKFEVNSGYTIPNVTIPVIGSEYIRLPIQPGCKGWVMTADAYLGGMSGLGSGVADLALRANLSDLVWSPLGNKNWDAPDDPDAVVIYGPNGAIIRTIDSSSVAKVGADEITLTRGEAILRLTDTAVSMIFGANSVVVNGTGIQLNGPLNVNGVASGPGGIVDFGASTLKTTGPVQGGTVVSAGNITSAGKSVGSTHTHSGVQTGGGNSGPPV